MPTSSALSPSPAHVALRDVGLRAPELADVDVFVGSRATMSSLAACIALLAERARVRLLCGPALLTGMYGSPQAPAGVEVVELALAGGDPQAETWSGLSTAHTVAALTNVWSERRPDVVLVHGDRCETLAAATAATIAGIAVAHTQGGERSGAIDNRVRAAVSALAALHLPESKAAARRLVDAGASATSVAVVGRIRLDAVHEALVDLDAGRTGALQEVHGGLPERFVLVAHHPDSDFPERAYDEMTAVVQGAAAGGLPVVCFSSNQDPGASGTRAALERSGARVLGQLSPGAAAAVLVRAAALVGNSSLVAWEADAAGVPALCVGSRQDGRDHALSMVRVPADAEAVAAALRQALSGPPVVPAAVPGGAAANVAENVVRFALRRSSPVQGGHDEGR